MYTLDTLQKFLNSGANIQKTKDGRVSIMRNTGQLDEAGNPQTYGTFAKVDQGLVDLLNSGQAEINGLPVDGGFLDPSNLAGTAFSALAGAVGGLGLGNLGVNLPSMTDFLPEGVGDFLGSGTQVDVYGNPLDVTGGGGGGLIGDSGGDLLNDVDVDNWDLMGDQSVLTQGQYQAPYDDGGVGTYANMGGNYMNTGTTGGGTGGGLTEFLKSDMGRILGGILPSALGLIGSSQKTDSLNALSDKFAGYGAPYRSKLADLYTAEGISNFLKSPEVTGSVQQGTDILGRALSTKFGNPTGSGTALQEMQNYATTSLYNKLGQERDRLGGFGGLTAYNQAAPSLAINAAGSEGDTWNAIGAGVSQIFNPRTSLEDILKGLRGLNSGVA